MAFPEPDLEVFDETKDESEHIFELIPKKISQAIFNFTHILYIKHSRECSKYYSKHTKTKTLIIHYLERKIAFLYLTEIEIIIRHTISTIIETKENYIIDMRKINEYGDSYVDNDIIKIIAEEFPAYLLNYLLKS